MQYIKKVQEHWKQLMGLRKWRIRKLKLINARLYFVSIFVGLLTGLIAVPYHYLLQGLFSLRKAFFASSPKWYEHVILFVLLWGLLLLVACLVKKMPFISGGGIPQTRGVINGRITYQHPFKELWAKFAGGIMALSAGLSLGREGPSVQIGSYVGTLVSKWTNVLRGERKQLLAAGAGAGLSAAFAAPLTSSLLVIESIERFDAPKTAITTLLAGVVAGGIAGWIFPVNAYAQIHATAPNLPFWVSMKFFLILAIVVSIFGKFYSILTDLFQKWNQHIRLSTPTRMFCLAGIAYLISFFEIDLTGGGEAFLLKQFTLPASPLVWIGTMLLIHLLFTQLSFTSGLPGGNFIPTLVTGGLFGQLFALTLIHYQIISNEHISYFMLLGMAAFLVAVVRTPLTAIVLITEITGHLEVFYPSIIVGGLTYYFTELLQIKPANVVLYNRMIQNPLLEEQPRYHLYVEVMDGSYFDGKAVDTLTLPNRCEIKSIRRDRKTLLPQGETLIPGDQVEIEMDVQDIEKLYEPLVSMANIY